MSILLEWDKTGEHLYETGVSNVAIYPAASTSDGGPRRNGYMAGVAWNGCTGVTEKPSGGDETKLWADNIKYLSLRSAEDYGATITCYTYPKEFAECDGAVILDSAGGNPVLEVSQQPRKSFCLVWKTLVGNDLLGNDYGYKLHILYGCTTSPSERANSTVNESPSANEFSFEISTTPIDPNITVSGKKLKATAHLVIDVSAIPAGTSGDADRAKITTLEELLYGKQATTNPEASAVDPQILMPGEIYAILYPAQA